MICYEGLVQVNTRDEEIKLPPDNIFKLEDGIASREENNVIPHLLTNESAFYSVPFTEVVKELERQYAVEIVTNDLNLEQRFTGSFVHSDLEMALKSVTIPMDLTFKITEDQRIILSGERK